jgi:hypothetical protein
MLLLLLACTAPTDEATIREAKPGRDTSADADTDTDSDTDTDTDTDADTGPCPPEMALAGSACVDRWEATIDGWSPYEVPAGGVAVSAEGVVPQGYISGDVAAAACEASGKRLCSLDEWMRACQGPDGTTWPYGNTYDANACNDTYAGGHPVVDYFGTSTGVWDGDHMNDPGINQQPGTVDPTGANPGCVSADGIHDLHGNLHEWIADSAGTFKGGFYADAEINGEGCTYTTTAHTTDYHDYSTGFRCCMDPR